MESQFFAHGCPAQRLHASPLIAAELPSAILTLAGSNGQRYHDRMIRSFAAYETEKLFRRERIRRLPPDIQRTALRKLVQLDAAISLDDLRVPPGSRLEALGGDRVGQHSIRINDQWRVCFVWNADGAEEVEIVDYH